MQGWNFSHLHIVLERLFHCRHLGSINLNFSTSISTNLKYFRNWKYLHSLSLSHCDIDDKMLNDILENVVPMRQLNLGHNRITNRYLPKLLSHCKEIVNLDLQYNRFTSRDIFFVIFHFLNLIGNHTVKLTLYSNNSLDDNFLFSMVNFFHDKEIQLRNYMKSLDRAVSLHPNESIYFSRISIVLEFEKNTLFYNLLSKYHKKLEVYEQYLQRKRNYFVFNFLLEKFVKKYHVLHMKDIQFLISEFL